MPVHSKENVVKTAGGFSYTLIRSQRKTLAVQIKRSGELEVRAPRWVGQGRIEAFLAERRDWIVKHRAAALEAAGRRAGFCVSIGGSFPLLGREQPVRETAGRPRFDGETIWLNSARGMKAQAQGICRQLMRETAAERVARYEPLVGVRAAGITITSAKGRFGSCSGKNRLSFAWRLAMAEPRLIDYVVVHELCHIREHNHSARFWAAVESVLPDYRAREVELRDFAAVLAGQDWEEET